MPDSSDPLSSDAGERTVVHVLFAPGAPADPSPDAHIQTADWTPVNDTVMGGVSSSDFVKTADGARFHGTVSLDRGGGFASVRAPEAVVDVSDANAFLLRLRGDEKTYKFTAYTSTGQRVSYRRPFAAAKSWTDLVIPFSEMEPYRRGRHVPSAPDFDPATLRTFGFLIGDKQDGEFHLEIQHIAAVNDAAVERTQKTREMKTPNDNLADSENGATE
jgi:monofunctional biosynthetic peptidoglycan transglycosylase